MAEEQSAPFRDEGGLCSLRFTPRMKQTTVTRDDFVAGVDDLLDRFKAAGGDPAFLVFTWTLSLAPASMDSLADVMSEQRDRLRANAPVIKRAARAVASIAEASEELRGLGFDVAKFVVDRELGRLERNLAFMLSHHARGKSSTKRLGPRPERMRYLMTAALVDYFKTRRMGGTGWRWEFIGDWMALVANSWSFVENAAGYGRFIDAIGLENQRLDRARLRSGLAQVVPSRVKVMDALDLKRWFETRALKSQDDLSRRALELGRATARSWKH